MYQNTRKTKIINMVGWTVSGAICVFAAVALIYDSADPYVCVETTTVKEILSIAYRSADILLANGQTVSVNQATFKPGSTYCLRYERESVAKKN